MASLNVNDAGTWKQPTPWVNDAGTWKKPQGVWVNDAGTWKQVWASLTFNPAPGSVYNKGAFNSSGSVTITASQAVTWTYTKDSTLTASVASGTTGTAINFRTNSPTVSGTATLTATSGGQTYQWDISLDGGNISA